MTEQDPPSSPRLEDKKEPSLSRPFRHLISSFCVLIALIVGAQEYLAYFYDTPGPLVTQKQLVLERGLSRRGIITQLYEQGVIKHPLLVMALIEWRHKKGSFKAGEYLFEPGVTLRSVIHKLITGDVVVRRITIPEGMTLAVVLERLQMTEGLTGEVSLNIKEGDLLPDTYQYIYGDTKDSVLAKMQAHMRVILETLWVQRASGLPIQTKEEAVILASIVEKETGVAEERSRVAAVFMNRLRKGIRLQSDPTVIYVLTQGKRRLEGGLTSQDLAIDSPYNTYKVLGLPPSPIANPGKESLQAVLHPAETEDLYFVAREDGLPGHRFAATLEEHIKNVQLYRKEMKQIRQKEGLAESNRTDHSTK